MMTKTITLQETTAAPPVKKGNRWRVIAARPGQGSSGFYSEDLLREQGPAAFEKNAQSFINHDVSRNPKDLIGIFPEGFYFDEDEKALVGELQVFSHWVDFVEEVAPHVGMSLFAAGEVDEDGNVVRLIPDRQNGVDLVSRPGLIGSGIAEKLYESAVHASSNEPGVNAAREGKETMELEKQVEELTKTVGDLAEHVKSLVSTQVAEAEQTAQVEADEAAVAEALDAFESRVAAINAEESLLPSQRKALIAEAKRGADVEPLIAEAKAIVEEARAGFAASSEDEGIVHGRVLGESAAKDALELGKVFG